MDSRNDKNAEWIQVDLFRHEIVYIQNENHYIFRVILT